jgi:hypothetical protein
MHKNYMVWCLEFYETCPLYHDAQSILEMHDLKIDSHLVNNAAVHHHAATYI